MKRLLLALGLLFFPLTNPAATPAGSAVEVKVKGGHGSGVYIGKGLVLTAAHVVFREDGPITVLRDDEQIGFEAEVVVLDLEHDFAVLRVKDLTVDAQLAASTVSCAMPTVGQEVMVAGWPLDLGKVIAKGYIASHDAERGPWPHSIIAIAPVTLGNSGGPAYDWRGRVMGIVVGVIGGTSLSVIVPLSAVCSQIPV